MKTVLIADDIGFMRLALRMILERHGFRIVGEAVNGSDAVVKYKELRPDLVTMDLAMPKLDGIGALQEIIGFDSTAKVVIVTATVDESKIVSALKLGAKSFLTKPFTEEHVLTVMNYL